MTDTAIPARRRLSPRASLLMLLLDVAGPLALFYGLRAADANQWVALVVSGTAPLLVLGYRVITDRRLEMATLFTLSILVCATAVGLLTGDPRLLLARESYLTGLVGMWMIATLAASRPFILQATLPLLPEEMARSWEHSWRSDPSFRRVLRVMTLAWGGAFLIDATARVAMAYTLPVDLVPVLSTLLLVAMLVTVVWVSKAYGRRMMDSRNAEMVQSEEAV